MVHIKFFGTARVKFGKSEMVANAKCVKELLQIVADEFGVRVKDIKQFLIYVNEINISKLKMWRTKLYEGDQIMFLSPASGG
ncbi:MAG TPA: MoaD/ThiS family protein [Clostridia bacterium]|nr:MoaD/ThiS family protein [Clostridia bacterium]